MIDALMPLIKQFLPFAQERMGFKEPPKLFLRGDSKNAENPLGKTAQYDPGARSITIYITARHPKDIMRSLSHELVHHTQCCNGELEGATTEPGYAQADDHMREMERQAYEMGNMCFRDWEDGLKETIYYEHLQKGENKMSTKDWKNKEVGTLISEAWGFGFNLDNLNEEREGGRSHNCSNHVKENATGREGRCINHTLTEGNEVTHYTVEFDDEIVENIPISELTELAGVTHKHPGKRDDYEHDSKKPRREHQISDEEPLEEEEEIEERRGRGRADPRVQRGKPDPRARPLEEDSDELEEQHGSSGKPQRRPRGVAPDRTTSSVQQSRTSNRPAEDEPPCDEENEDCPEQAVAEALGEDEELEERRGRGRKGPHIRGEPDHRLREEIKNIIRKALKAEGIVRNEQEK